MLLVIWMLSQLLEKTDAQRPCHSQSVHLFENVCPLAPCFWKENGLGTAFSVSLKRAAASPIGIFGQREVHSRASWSHTLTQSGNPGRIFLYTWHFWSRPVSPIPQSQDRSL